METKQIKCDDCTKKNCPERLKGSVCSINKNLSPLISASKTRDPIQMSQFIVTMVGSEYERYLKAKEIENIGGVSEKTIRHNDGKEYTVTEVKSIDGKVTDLAMNIIKSGKILNEILNPPKVTPLFQTNIQNNFGAMVADEIRALGGIEKDEAIKFIDNKLDAKRAS